MYVCMYVLYTKLFVSGGTMTCDDVVILSGGIGQGERFDCIAGDVVRLDHRRCRNHPLRDGL